MMKSYMQRKMDLINQQLNEIYTENMALNKDLAKAMNYSLMAGGKRLRPILIMAAADALGVDGEKFLRLSTSIEFIHTYSLIHDDLPAMDNDDYRRGNLTNHKVYGEGLAILAGDGLLTYAFQLMTSNTVASAQQKIDAIQCVATAAGPEGMVGGQAFELLSEDKHIPLEELKVLHSGKTGALFNASVELGLILGSSNNATRTALMEYSNCLGLLFQITDDILDVVGDEKTIGKPVGSDEKNHKSTYVTLGSLESAKALAQEAVDKAKASLVDFGENAEFLRALVDYLITRNK